MTRTPQQQHRTPNPFTDNTKAGNKTLDMKSQDKGPAIYGSRFEELFDNVIDFIKGVVSSDEKGIE